VLTDAVLPTPTIKSPMVIVALVVSLAILAALTVMQVLLIAGASIGEYAWGGQHRVLPSRLRVAAVVAIVLYAVFAALLLSRGGILPGGSSAVVVVGGWVLFGYAVLSVLANLVSKSRKERNVQAPISILLAISIGLVAALG